MSSLLSLISPFLGKLGECPFLRTPFTLTQVDLRDIVYSVITSILCKWGHGKIPNRKQQPELPTLNYCTIPWGIQCSIKQHSFDAEGSFTATLLLWSPAALSAHMFLGWQKSSPPEVIPPLALPLAQIVHYETRKLDFLPPLLEVPHSAKLF